MDVARLNFSHGTQTEHLEVITTLRRIAERLGKSIAILQDLAGLKIRIGRSPLTIRTSPKTSSAATGCS
jgi:pyruvate kinase